MAMFPAAPRELSEAASGFKPGPGSGELRAKSDLRRAGSAEAKAAPVIDVSLALLQPRVVLLEIGGSRDFALLDHQASQSRDQMPHVNRGVLFRGLKCGREDHVSYVASRHVELLGQEREIQIFG